MALRVALLAGLVASATAADVVFNGRFLEEADAAGDMASGDVSPPPAAPTTEVVEMAFEASGDLSDYTDDVKDGIAAAYAAEAGVPASSVTVNVVSGSVLVTVTIAVPDTATANTVTSALSSSTSNATALSALLSTVSVGGSALTVSSITSSLTVAAPPPPSSPSGLSAGAIAGIVVGSVIGGCLLLFILYKICKNLADSPGGGGVPLMSSYSKKDNKYGAGAAGTVEITGNKGAVDVI